MTELNYIQMFVRGENPHLRSIEENNGFFAGDWNYYVAYLIESKSKLPEDKVNVTIRRTAYDHTNYSSNQYDQYDWVISSVSEDAFIEDLTSRLRNIYGEECRIFFRKI